MNFFSSFFICSVVCFFSVNAALGAGADSSPGVQTAPTESQQCAAALNAEIFSPPFNDEFYQYFNPEVGQFDQAAVDAFLPPMLLPIFQWRQTGGYYPKDLENLKPEILARWQLFAVGSLVNGLRHLLGYTESSAATYVEPYYVPFAGDNTESGFVYADAMAAYAYYDHEEVTVAVQRAVAIIHSIFGKQSFSKEVVTILESIKQSHVLSKTLNVEDEILSEQGFVSQRTKGKRRVIHARDVVKAIDEALTVIEAVDLNKLEPNLDALTHKRVLFEIIAFVQDLRYGPHLTLADKAKQKTKEVKGGFLAQVSGFVSGLFDSTSDVKNTRAAPTDDSTNQAPAFQYRARVVNIYVLQNIWADVVRYFVLGFRYGSNESVKTYYDLFDLSAEGIPGQADCRWPEAQCHEYREVEAVGAYLNKILAQLSSGGSASAIQLADQSFDAHHQYFRAGGEGMSDLISGDVGRLSRFIERLQDAHALLRSRDGLLSKVMLGFNDVHDRLVSGFSILKEVPVKGQEDQWQATLAQVLDEVNVQSLLIQEIEQDVIDFLDDINRAQKVVADLVQVLGTVTYPEVDAEAQKNDHLRSLLQLEILLRANVVKATRDRDNLATVKRLSREIVAMAEANGMRQRLAITNNFGQSLDSMVTSLQQIQMTPERVEDLPSQNTGNSAQPQ